VLLRNPTKRLGVLYLERGDGSPRFTIEHLRLADGLAAYLSTGIACANSCNSESHRDTPSLPEQLQNDPVGQLIRNSAGPAYEQILPDPRWLTCDVIDVARAIRLERAFERMPILSDALLDAGCDNDEIIGHCRQSGFHVRGCWVLDLLLGKDDHHDGRGGELAHE